MLTRDCHSQAAAQLIVVDSLHGRAPDQADGWLPDASKISQTVNEVRAEEDEQLHKVLCSVHDQIKWSFNSVSRLKDAAHSSLVGKAYCWACFNLVHPALFISYKHDGTVTHYGMKGKQSGTLHPQRTS